MEMARYILKVLLTKPVVMFSWGLNNIRAIDDGIVFAVQGYLHKGDVRITYDQAGDCFCITTLKADGSVKESHGGVYLSELVDTVDAMVELCENYRERVMSDYFST